MTKDWSLCIVVVMLAFIISLMVLMLQKLWCIANKVKCYVDETQNQYHLPVHYHTGQVTGGPSNIRIASSSPRLHTRTNCSNINQQRTQPSTSLNPSPRISCQNTPPPLPSNPPCINRDCTPQQANGGRHTTGISGSHDSINSLYGQDNTPPPIPLPHDKTPLPPHLHRTTHPLPTSIGQRTPSPPPQDNTPPP
ncbi:hypothetical protein Pcinc_002661 [Petrolisthes cinctipes]|uniref:Uncharacterized protein n=1 Tax=Petrolisthes cinctipes TaxID=88211 RepID=A0AAE1GKI2_PETCI|nr:hypothetical protein Pcinc_002661 [Petrolisthes cinctipes]